MDGGVHLAFNDDSGGTAVAARSWEQVFNLIVSATTQGEAGDDRAIKPSPQTEKARRIEEHAGGQRGKATSCSPATGYFPDRLDDRFNWRS